MTKEQPSVESKGFKGAIVSSSAPMVLVNDEVVVNDEVESDRDLAYSIALLRLRSKPQKYLRAPDRCPRNF